MNSKNNGNGEAKDKRRSREEDLDEIVLGGIVTRRESDGGKSGLFLLVDVAIVFFVAVAVVIRYRQFLPFLHLSLSESL